MDQKKLVSYITLLGDNSMILGQRLGELCGHGPELETDIALTNISLDLFGQVRNYFQYAAEVEGKGRSEDDLAMLRLEHEYKNSLLVEQPNTDFAFVIVRQFFYDTFHQLLMRELMKSKDDQLAAIAKKSIKEVDYHYDFSSTWMKRLGDGTGESHERAQHAVNELWRFAMDLFKETEVEKWAAEIGIGPDLKELKASYLERVKAVCEEATLELPKDEVFQYGGKEGRHSEYMGYILTDFQFMQRTYPDMKW
ncbi:MAG: 1,2-phenylacetyl-CoA epoxidase subunit PaaC [Vicingaceae bacterium]